MSRPLHNSLITRSLTLLSLLSLMPLSACVATSVEGEEEVFDFGSLGTKADGESVREVDVSIAPGATKRFRVSAVRFHAVLAQATDMDAQLTAKHYEVELEGEVAEDAELEAVADQEMLRNWTLRVTNFGDEQLEGTLTIVSIFDLGDEGEVLREVDVEVAANSVRRFRVRGASIEAELTTSPSGNARLSAKNYELEYEGTESTNPTLTAESPDEELRNWTLRVHNETSSVLRGHLTVRVAGGGGGDPDRTGRPTLEDDVLFENDYCEYQNSIPYVKTVKWDHPTVQAALSNITGGWRSTFSFGDWRVPYGLERDSASTGTDDEISFAKARNWIRVACGEHRDFPDMLKEKLEAVAFNQHMAGPGQMDNVDTDENLFTQLTTPAYDRLVSVMGAMHSYRSRSGSMDGYHYGKGRFDSASRRQDHSVAPTTHCEMKFIFENYLVSGSPSVNGSRFESEYADYRESDCSADDLNWMYNFRGHVNFQPLWLESNGFIFNSRRARTMDSYHDDNSYYQRPFATRHTRARSLLGSYLFHPDDDHSAMVRASDSGGGPILYITDQDTDEDHLLDYRLFSRNGCGDQGVGSSSPTNNCNMVSWETAAATENTTGHAEGWSPDFFASADMGFMRTFTTFEERMGRFNQALDRHTNWGPTGYYMNEASRDDDESPRFIGTYSPIVAASYDVSASNYFVHRDFPSTHPWEQGRAKWLYVMRFRADNYYDEEDLRDGQDMDFDRHYFNETSLSNDFYNERALDHWGYIPTQEAYAQVYLTYGDRGQTPPTPPTVPTP